MQPENELITKRDRHYTNIRRDARQKKLTQMRREAYFETVPITNVAQGFRLAPKEQGDYTIMEIFVLTKASLLNVQDSINNMQEEEGSNSSFLSLSAHINFWAFLLQEIFTDRLYVNEELQDFFVDFMKRNPYKIIAMSTLLLTKVTNTLEIAMLPITATELLKETGLDWVKGTRGLPLIYNSLLNKFLPPREYENVYEVIKEALSLATFDVVTDCCQIIRVILSYADYEQTESIYADESDLMVYLLKAIEPFIEENNVARLADAVISLTDTYEDIMLDYARTGVALLGTRMITSKRIENVEKGLEIIKHISEIEKFEAITFLLEDRELNEAGLWKAIFSTNDILENRNISIRREGFTILSNVMAHGDENNLTCLMTKVEESFRNSLFDLIASSVKIDEDPTILKSLLVMIGIILYYSSRSENEDKEFMVNYIQETQIHNLIEELTRHTNTEIAESATELYDNVRRFLGQSDQ